jgi:DNA-binding response OmpR family regulator
MNTIYIAEDEHAIRETIISFLNSEGYYVIGFDNGDALFETFSKQKSDLVILDVNMPGSNGFEITKKIRQMSTVPILLLTARDSDLDYATGINLGSDDYFTKPFSAIALVMRVKALLRRVEMDQKSTENKDEVQIEDLSINRKTLEVKINHQLIELTPMEYQVLCYFFDHPEQAISRDELLNNVWGYQKEVETRACDDTIRRLRKKIESCQVQIETVWGFGFKIGKKHV